MVFLLNITSLRSARVDRKWYTTVPAHYPSRNYKGYSINSLPASIWLLKLLVHHHFLADATMALFNMIEAASDLSGACNMHALYFYSLLLISQVHVTCMYCIFYSLLMNYFVQGRLI